MRHVTHVSRCLRCNMPQWLEFWDVLGIWPKVWYFVAHCPACGYDEIF